MSASEFDVGISFAGENRDIATEIARRLKAEGFKVFLDTEEQANLLGKCLTEELTEYYQKRFRYCIVLVSFHYVSKRWTRLEWRAAQARAFEELGSDYILPIRLDAAELPGLLPTMGFLSLSEHGIERVVAVLSEKLRGAAELNRAIREADNAFSAGNFKVTCELLSNPNTFPRIQQDRVAMRLLADAYMATSQFEQALPVYEVVVSRNEQDQDSLFQLGICLGQCRHHGEAAATFSKLLRLVPAHHSAKEHLKHNTRSAGFARLWEMLSGRGRKS